MTPADRIRGRVHPELFAVVIANALPLVGIVGFGWDVVGLVVLYWLELGVSFLLALVRATFADRPSEFDDDSLIIGALADRRVALSIPRTGLSVRISTLPVLAAAVPTIAIVWFFVGVMTVGVVAPESPDPEMLRTVVIAGFGVFIAEIARTGLEYFHRGGYREHSAQTALRGELSRGIAIGFGGLFTVLFVALASNTIATDEPIGSLEPELIGTPVLIGIVLVKFGFGLSDVYRDRLVALDESSAVPLGWAYEPPTEEPVDTALSADASRIRPDPLGRALGGIGSLRRRYSALFAGAFFFPVAGLFAMGRAWDVAVLLAGAGVLVPLLLVQFDAWLRYAGVEYRTDGDAIVAYDRLFRTPLWRVEPWDETGLRVERGWFDAWLDTATVVIELPDSERRLPWLPDADPIRETFDRRPG